MSVLFDLSVKETVAVIFVTIGTALIVYDIRGIIHGLKLPDKEHAGLIVKGIRVFTTLTGIGLLLAAGIFKSDTLLLLGLVIGIQELYETTVVLAALRFAKNESALH